MAFFEPPMIDHDRSGTQAPRLGAHMSIGGGLPRAIDRHDGIGRGCIGVEPFRRLLRDARFRHVPMVLETPKANSGGADEIAADALDLENLAILKRFRDEV